jgi:hypothetical protein
MPGNLASRGNIGFLLVGMLAGAAAITLLHRGPVQPDLSALPQPARIERPCDPSSSRTAILVILGQSNAANYGSSRQTARHGVDNFDPASGKCFAAADPLLGADGAGGHFGTRLGDLLIDAGRYDRVVVLPLGIHAASLSELNNAHAPRLDAALASLKAAKLVPTHLLFQQGETDAILSTTRDEYVSQLQRYVARIRAVGIDAPFYVSRSSKCDVESPRNTEAVRAGQLAAIDPQLDIRPGPDTDTIGNDGRNPFDGCHMNEAGTLANAALWAAFID